MSGFIVLICYPTLCCWYALLLAYPAYATTANSRLRFFNDHTNKGKEKRTHKKATSFLKLMALLLFNLLHFYTAQGANAHYPRLNLAPMREPMRGSINDNELLTMFAKVQLLSNKQQDTVKDFLSAFVLKTDLQKNLAAK